MRKAVLASILGFILALGALWYVLRDSSAFSGEDPRLPGITTIPSYKQSGTHSAGKGELSVRIVDLIRAGDWRTACSLLAPLVDSLDAQPGVARLQGQCLLRSQSAGEALVWLRKAQKMDPGDTTVHHEIIQAQALLAESEQLGVLRSVHFELQVEDKVFAHGTKLLGAMEDSYDSLCLRWSYYPERPLAAVLYTSKIYQGALDLPDWTGALFDGKVRIPANVLEDWPKYRAVIAHEVAHAFHQELAGGRALPTWLDEGLAQDFDGTRLDTVWMRDFPEPDSAALSGNFLSTRDAVAARVLYQYSLRKVRDLLDAVGRDSVRTLIRRGFWGERKPAE